MAMGLCQEKHTGLPDIFMNLVHKMKVLLILIGASPGPVFTGFWGWWRCSNQTNKKENVMASKENKINTCVVDELGTSLLC